MSQLSTDNSQLVRDELRLAQVEVTGKAKQAGIGAGLFGVAGMPTGTRGRRRHAARRVRRRCMGTEQGVGPAPGLASIPNGAQSCRASPRT